MINRNESLKSAKEKTLKKSKDMLSSTGEKLVDFLDNLPNIINNAEKTVEEKIENHKNRRQKKFLEKRTLGHYLVIKSNFDAWKTSFNVLDENGNIKYIIKSKSSRSNRQMKLLSSKGREIGSVKQRLFTKQSIKPFSGTNAEYIIEIYGEKIGSIQANFHEIKSKAELNFNKWQIEGNLFNYRVIDKGIEIAKMTLSVRCSGTILNFSNPSDEVLLLLVSIALTAVTADKKPGSLFSGD